MIASRPAGTTFNSRLTAQRKIDIKGSGAAVCLARDRPDRGQTRPGDLDTWRDWWRDVLSASSGAMSGIINSDREEALSEESKVYKQEDVIRFLRALDETRVHLKENVDPQLALEVLVLKLPKPLTAFHGGMRRSSTSSLIALAHGRASS